MPCHFVCCFMAVLCRLFFFFTVVFLCGLAIFVMIRFDSFFFLICISGLSVSFLLGCQKSHDFFNDLMFLLFSR